LIFIVLLSFSVSCSTVRQEVYPKTLEGRTYAVASWYGPKFHGRPTASGEIYNMYADTCAHKAYPFGLRLNVTNLQNNRTAECVVNDRGPFVKGRDIDLSYSVAKKIGLLGPGVGKVLLEAQGRDSSYIKRVKIQTMKRAGPFAIQVGSFIEKINAIRLKTALKLAYNNVYIQDAIKAETRYYRVRIGNFDNYENALSVARQLGQTGYKTIVIKAEVKL
jgi:rare lipoprotein A